jgi:membrane fusion protein (multidrug efflux system)
MPIFNSSGRAGAAAAAALTGLTILAAGDAGLFAAEFECLVEPYLEVNVSSAVPGILDEVAVDRGDVVTTGQVLVRLKSDVERANYDLVKARAEFAARNVKRNEELYRKQMISVHEKDELETQMQLLRLEIREVEERLKLREIRSPLTGVVVKRHYSPGEFVESEPILELAQIDPLRVEVAVPVAMHGRIKVGMTAAVRWEAPVDATRQARVTVVDPLVDPASGMIGIRLELANPNGELPAGTQCSVRFPVASE